MLTRRHVLSTLATLPITGRTASALAFLAPPPPPNPRFTVLSLFRPQRLLLHAQNAPLTVQLDDTTLTLTRTETLIIDATPDALTTNQHPFTTLTLPNPATFALEVPQKLRRTYTGALTLANEQGHLRAVVTIDRELAVASIVAAESPPHAPLAALAAQAIAARSFLTAAHTTHLAADFCDTTHCQFLREAPPPASPFTLATHRTRNLVLQFRDPASANLSTLPALYSRSCGGHTRTLAELGIPTRGYPYFAVPCAFCQAHPERWRNAPTTHATTELDRLVYNRIHGWSALPGHPDPGALEGRGIGHGIGLCQLGAAAMAFNAATYTAILAHYYPNTVLHSL